MLQKKKKNYGNYGNYAMFSPRKKENFTFKLIEISMKSFKSQIEVKEKRLGTHYAAKTQIKRSQTTQTRLEKLLCPIN